MYSTNSPLISGVTAAALLGALYLYKTVYLDPPPGTGQRNVKPDSAPKPVADSTVHVSYRVTSDMADEHGRMFAGEILKLIDIVAGVASRRHAETGCVTITLDRFILVQEVRVGDLLHLNASVNRAWNTSMETGVKVVRESAKDGRQQYCCHAYLTFVAIAPAPKGHSGPSTSIRLGGRVTANRAPRPKVRKILPITLIEKKRYLLAGHRRDLRMAESAESQNGLKSFRAEVLELSRIAYEQFSLQSDDQHGPALFAMEKELLLDAMEANDPAVVRSFGPDGEEFVTLSDKLLDGVDSISIPLSELNASMETHKRERRNTWTPSGTGPFPPAESSAGMTRSTSSWMMEPNSPVKSPRKLRLVDMPTTIPEDVFLSPVADTPLRSVCLEETLASTLHIVMPQHANSAGVLFGGQLMEWMEKTALIAASRLRREGCCWTTAGMDGLEFREAVAIGDVLTFRAVVTRTWRSSIEVYVCSHADVPSAGSSPRFTNECFISLVALSHTSSAAIPLNTRVHIEAGTIAEQVSRKADHRKEDRLNMKDMLVRLYASSA